MSYILVIDQGTTSTRTIIFNQATEVISMAQKEITQYYPKPGWVYHDANEIWLSVLTTMTQAIYQKNINPKDIAVIGITNQRETVVAWDKKTEQPLHHAIVWQSRQTQEHCEKLKKDGYETIIKNKTGLIIDPYFSATKMTFLMNNIPNIETLLKEERLAFGTIDSFIMYKLTGQHLTDVSNASRTMLFNIHTLTWDQELLALFNIPIETLPQVRPSSSIFGYTKPHHFFGEEIPIGGVLGDQQAALFGQRAFSKGDIKNTYGTGCFLLMNTGREIILSQMGLLSTIAWQIDDEVTYALEGSVFVGGSAVQWLRDGLKIIENAKDTEPHADALKHNEGVYMVPAFVGLGTPYWASEARGAIFGITRGTTEKHFSRAALESIAYQSYDVIEAMRKDSNIPIASIHVDGGATSNPFLMQFQADIMGLDVIKPDQLESTARGIAWMAGFTIGIYKDLEAISKLKISSKTYHATMSEDLRFKLLQGWKEAVKATIQYKRPSFDDLKS
jgi:glycerol kinase